jgi:methanogenic corrinoid protein MtbC1
MAGTDVDCWADEGGSAAGQTAPALPAAEPMLTGELLARLVRTIEGEIVPRLMLVQRASVRLVAPAVADHKVVKPDVEAFVSALLRNGTAELSAYVESLHARGVTTEALLLDLFAPAARRLGRMWEDDACSFTDVTLALSHLHRLVHELRHDDQARASTDTGEPRILLTVTEREQHLFGLLVVADCFRSAGWRVDEDHVGSPRSIAASVRSTHFDLVGVSVSSEERVEPAAVLVRTVRKASCNAAVPIMAGGPVFLRVPEIAERLGVDAISTDARQAVEKARALLANIPSAKTRRV